MKRLVSVVICVVVLLLIGACNSNDTPQYSVDDLTADDYKFIDTVYECIDKWDVGTKSLGKIYYVDTISFFEFASIDKMSFYINFQFSQTTYNSAISSTSNSTTGFLISDDDLERITDKTFDDDNVFTAEEQANQTRHMANKTATAGSGTKWKHSASDEEKYQIITDAYVDYLNTYK